MYGRKREPYDLKSAYEARNYYKTVIKKEQGYQPEYYRGNEQVPAQNMTGTNQFLEREDPSKTQFRPGALNPDRQAQTMNMKYSRPGELLSQVPNPKSDFQERIKTDQSKIELEYPPNQPGMVCPNQVNLPSGTTEYDYYATLGHALKPEGLGTVTLPARSNIIQPGPYYTKAGYIEYQGKAAGVTSEEYEDIRKRQESNLRGPTGLRYDDGERAAGVTSAEYEEIKRRQAMNRPTQINYQAMQRSDAPYQIPAQTITNLPNNAPISQNTNPNFQIESQAPTQAQAPMQVPQNMPYKLPEGPRTQEPPRNPYLDQNVPNNQSEPLQKLYQASEERYNPPENQVPSQRAQPSTQVMPQNNPVIPTAGGGKILASNESSGVQGCIDQGYIHNVNNYSKTFGGNQPIPQQNYNYDNNYGIPTQPRPALKQGVESNESYGVSDALNANFVPYDGSVGPREILDANEYGPRTGELTYKIAGGNVSSGVGGVFAGH